jgi:hypothetical protein
MPAVTTKQTGNAVAAPKAPNQTIPYEQPDQLTPVIKPFQGPQANSQLPGVNPLPAASNQPILSAINQGALSAQNQQNPTMGLVQQNVQKVLKNPMGEGYDPNKYMNNQLEQYDRNRGSAMLAFQQSNADISNTGAGREKAYNYAMQGAQGRSDLENKIQFDQGAAEREAMLKSLTAGSDVVKTQSGLDESAFNRLINAQGAAEGGLNRQSAEKMQATGFANTVELEKLGYDQDVQKMAIANGYDLVKMDKTFGNEMTKLVTESNLDTASKTSLMTLQDAFDTGRLLKTQDFEAIQKDLDRQEKIALQNGDIAGQIQIQTLRGEIDAKAQEAQQNYNTSERYATQAYSTLERIDKQTYDTASKYIDQNLAIARANNDADNESMLMDKKGILDLKMQTNEMGQEERMAFLNNEYATSMANGNVDRQRQIITFQTGQTLETMAAEGNIKEGQMQIQAGIDEAMAQSDFVRADALQTSRFVFDGQEKTKDRVLDQARLDLTAKTTAFDSLFKAFDAGTVSADSVMSLVKSAMKDYGITVTEPDPMATEKELNKEFNQTKIQFALSHPEFAFTDGGIVTGLQKTPEAQKAFNDFINKTVYGATGSEQGTTPETAVGWNGIQDDQPKFSITPPAEGSVFKMPNGSTYTRSVGNLSNYNGRESYSAVDSSTGETIQVIAGEGIKYSSAPQRVFDPSMSKAEVDQYMKNSQYPYSKVPGYTATSWGGNPYESDYTIKKV